jgi:hypothetical protein
VIEFVHLENRRRGEPGVIGDVPCALARGSVARGSSRSSCQASTYLTMETRNMSLSLFLCAHVSLLPGSHLYQTSNRASAVEGPVESNGIAGLGPL